MKKNVFLRFFILSLFFVSCANPFKDLRKNDNHKMVTIKMTATMDGAVPSKFLSSINQSTNTRTALPKLPEISDIDNSYTFNIEAKCNDSEVSVSNFTWKVENESIAFNFTIESNKTYDINIFCSKNGVKILQGTSKLVVSDNSAPSGNIKLNRINNEGQGLCELKCDFSDLNGSFNVVISKIEKLNDDGTFTDASNSFCLYNAGIYTKLFSGNNKTEPENISAGAYLVTFDINKTTGSKERVYSFTQSINIFSGLTTDIWQATGGEQYFIYGTDGKYILTITKAFIQSMSRTTFYVSKDDDISVDDNNKRCGSYNYPLGNLRTAFDIINNSNFFDSDQEFSIILKDEGTYTLEVSEGEGQTYINKNVIVKGYNTYKTETENSREKYVLKYEGAHSSPMFTVNKSGINVTFENLTVDGESDNDNKKFSKTGFLIANANSCIVNIDNVEIKKFSIYYPSSSSSNDNYGSVFYITSSDTSKKTELKINSSLITDCGITGMRNYGGVIYLKTSKCNIKSSEISSCYIKANSNGAMRGGAIFIDGYASCDILESVLSGNYINQINENAYCYGGAIFISNSGECSIYNNSVIKENYIDASLNSAYGGAIYVNADSNLLIYNNVEINNNYINSSGSSSYGGAICNIGTCTIESANIYGNYINCSVSVNSFGGAIYDSGTLNLGDDNKNGTTGNPDVLIGKNDTYQGPNYIKSKSNSYGGAVCVYNSVSTIFTMKSDVCIGNYSVGDYQRINLNGNDITTNCGNYIFMNSTKYKDAFGGGLYIGRDVTATINGGIVNANNIYVNNSQGDNHFCGAGIYSLKVCNLTDMEIKYNIISGKDTDTIQGVGLHLGENNTVLCTLENIDISGNQSFQSNSGNKTEGVGAYLDFDSLTLDDEITFGENLINNNDYDIYFTGSSLRTGTDFRVSGNITIDCPNCDSLTPGFTKF